MGGQWSGMERVLEFVSDAAGVLVTGALVLAFLAAGTFDRDVCVSRTDGSITYGDWKFSPLAWFSPASLNETEICESQTFTMSLVEKVPVFGDAFEEAVGGPHNPDYYRNN